MAVQQSMKLTQLSGSTMPINKKDSQLILQVIDSSNGTQVPAYPANNSLTWANKKTPSQFGIGSAYFSDIDETLYCNGTSWEIPKFKKNLVNLLPDSLKVNKVMATPPTVNLVTGSDTSDIVSPIKYQFNTTTEVVGSNFCSLAMAQNPVLLDAASPKNLYSKFNSQYAANGYEFRKINVAVKHTGQVISFHGYTLLDAATAKSSYVVKVDGEFISLTPTVISPVDTQFVLNLDFGSVAERKIEFISYYCALGGISTAATDTLIRAELMGPEICFLGDSLVEGAYGDRLVGDYVAAFSQSLGYDKVSPRGFGGSRIAAGTGNYISRIPVDIDPYPFDVIIVQLSVNETGLTTLNSDLRNLLTQLRASKPKALLGVTAPMLRGGCNMVTTAWWNAIYACQDVVENEFDGFFLNHYEQPLADGSPVQTLTLRSFAAQAAATIGTTTIPSIGACFKFADNTHIRVKSVSGSEPTVTVTLDSVLQTSQASGNVATEVGHALHTGTGYLGATTGWGNGDNYIYSDFKHYVALGHAAMGRCLAALYVHELKSRFGD